MALPTTFGPAHDAIYEALTTDTGRTRALAPEYLFKRLADRRDQAGTEGEAIKFGKAVLVTLRDFGAAAQPEMEPGDRIRYAGTVEILRVYHARSDLMPAERERARLLACDDTHRIRQALCFPGALTLDASSNETGISGGALDPFGWRSRGPDAQQGRGYLTCLDTFPVTISLLVG